MKIAVVILNWNGRSLLEQFLPSVSQYSKEANIYVADNASTDNSVAYVRENFPEIHIIRNKINGGYAKGYNDALKDLSEDIFILLNSDVEVTPGWLPPLLAEFKNSPETAALQPKVLDLKQREFFEYAGAAGGFIDQLGYPYCRGRLFTSLEKDQGQYDDTSVIFWASGACMAIRKKAFYEVNGFDEDFFAHQEEIDLCWRLFNRGWQIKAVGTSKVYHLGGATLNNMNPRKTFYNFRNSLFCLLKNAPTSKVAFLVFLRLVLDAIAGIKFLTERKPWHTVAILKAHFSFYSHLQRFIKKRKNLPKKEKYYCKTSVVYAYYVKGVRKYPYL